MAVDTASHDLVVRVITEHAEMLLGVARRHSVCADDAQEAYGRALEVLVRRAGTLDPETAHRWLSVVVKHEAWAVRRARAQLVGVDPELLEDLDAARDRESPEERAEGRDDAARAAEALRSLKPQEVQALWLKAQGLSYLEIAERQGWTYTKVNRSITEGRRAFLRRYAGIEAGRECERWAPVLSALVDGEAAPRDLAAVRPHLRNCPACRALLGELRAAQSRIELVLPPDVLGAAVAVAGAAGAAGLGAAAAGGGATVFAGAGKLAAIAATTLALTGGGVVVERSLPDRTPAAAAAAGLGPAEPASPASAPVAVAAPVPERVGAPDPEPEPAGTPAPRPAADPVPAPPAPAPAPAEREFEPAAAPAPPAPGTAAFEPAAAPPAPAAPAAPAPPASPAADEFGLG